MANLTQILPSFRGEEAFGATRMAVALAAAQADAKKGALMAYDAGASSVLKHCADTANFEFAGVVLDGGSAGETLQLATDGIFGPYTHSGGSLTAANIGDIVCAGADDQTVQTAAAATNDVIVGRIHEVVSASLVMIRIGPAIHGR